MRQKRLHQREVASEHGGVQSAVPNRIVVCRSALIQQQCPDRAMTAVCCQHQGAHLVGQGLIDIGTCAQQQPDRFDIAGSHREEQGRTAATLNCRDRLAVTRSVSVLDHLGVGARAGVNIGAELQ